MKQRIMKPSRRMTAIVCAVLIGTAAVGCGTVQQESGGGETTTDELQEDSVKDQETADVKTLLLSETTATLDGKAVEEFSYSWHMNPSREGEWFEGDTPDTDAAAYIAHDIRYYPKQDTESFTMEEYDGETEWVSRYTAEDLTNYVFSTLPVEGDTLPVEMMHTEEEAQDNPVLHITKPGTYILQGTWNGQIAVDLGEKEETFTDEEAVVTLILNGVEVNCTCSPAFVAYSAYECDNTWEEEETEADTTDAGIRIVVADGTINSFSGANIYRLLKPEYKKDSSSVQKKYYKIDGAFYSYVSMEIEGQEAGSGILNIRSTYEGLDDELHLTINGGNINIYSQNDGINVNEDGVSRFTMNDGVLHIFAGLGAEGDGIDSNGYIVINGGLIAGGTPSGADEILDSDCGTTINGGEVITIGSQRGPEGMGDPGDGPREDFRGDSDSRIPPEGMELPDGNFRPPVR